MDKKTILKVIYVFAIGLCVSILCYPFLHETGHSLMALICGGKVISFSLFPAPYILCDASGLANWENILVGMSGMLFPMIIFIFLHPHSFYAWYPVFLFKGIVWLSFSISITMLVLNYCGMPDYNDDIVKVIGFWNNGFIPLMLICSILLSLSTLSIYKDHPIKRLISYIES